MSFRAKKVPKQTPLKEGDPEVRVAYAKHGPILNGGVFTGKLGQVTLPEDWEKRKLKIGFLDHKPFWLDSSSVKNRFY